MATSDVPTVADKTADVDHRQHGGAPFSLTDATSADIRALKPASGDGLHPVEIHDDRESQHPAGEAPSRAGDSPTTQPSPVAPSHEWTVGYFLGATKTMDKQGQPGDQGPQTADWGSAHKAEQLKEMAASTKGTDVTVLVDSLHEKDDVRAQRQQLVDEGKLDQGDLASHNPDDYLVDHYKLKDGQIQDLGSTPSKGLTDDVKDLVSHASHDDPSKKVGLVVNVDGGGDRGVMGDSSPIASMPQLQAAIKDGLSGSGHDRLDILDMDACLMSQTGSVASMGAVARDIVASAETERSAVDRVDGQNLGSGLQHLLDHPEMSGSQWGEQIVGDAKNGANTVPHDGPETKFDTGTSTLANIDGDKTQPLARAVDQLGVALKGALSDPASKSTINGIIDKLPRYGADGSSTDSYGEQKRDLTALTGELQKALASGTIKDPDGKIASSLAAVDTAEKAAVTSYSGSHDGGYDRNGGVSIYLPDSTFRDIDKTLAQDTPLSQAAEVLDRFAHLPTPTEGPDQIRDGSVTASSAQQYVGSYLQKLDAHQKEEGAPLVEAMEQLGRAGSPQERQAALQHASDVAHQMLQSKLQQELVASADHAAADKLRQQKLDREMDGELPGWKGFVQALEWRG